MSLRIAVIGKTGQLGRALLHEGQGLGHEIISIGRDTLDLTSPRGYGSTRRLRRVKVRR